jgi:hypothetical protein
MEVNTPVLQNTMLIYHCNLTLEKRVKLPREITMVIYRGIFITLATGGRN